MIHEMQKRDALLTDVHTPMTFTDDIRRWYVAMFTNRCRMQLPRFDEAFASAYITQHSVDTGHP